MSANILFIVADDLNSWIGALGRNPNVKTPNIDALAARGALFTHAYCAAPYCNASRMSVFTGCLPTTTGIYANEPFWEVPQHRRTFVELLRHAGYYTYGAGKVFHGVFDYVAAGRNRESGAKWQEIENRPFLWDEFQTNSFDPLPDGRPLNRLFDSSDFSVIPPQYHIFDWGALPDDRIDQMPDAVTARSIAEFLHASPRQPFFCAAGLYKPHLPWHVPRRFFDLYDVDKISLPLVKDDDLDDVPAIGREWVESRGDHKLVIGRGAWRHAVQGYLASMSYCDYVIGEILGALGGCGLSNDTMIVLWADHGFHLGEKLHWRKFVLWEEATRVPLILVPPGAAGVPYRIHAPVSLIDIFPTIFDFCEVPHRLEIDGISLRGMLADATQRRRTPPIMTWGRGNHSLRTEQWRFTRYSDGAEELYDHLTDHHEWTNLAGNPDFDGVRNELRQFLPTDA